MCLVSKPKPVSVTRDEKDPQVLRNPYLDGLDPIIRARQGGLKALRIERGTPVGQRPTLPSTLTAPPPPPTQPTQPTLPGNSIISRAGNAVITRMNRG